jgi:hypothetical protein
MIVIPRYGTSRAARLASGDALPTRGLCSFGGGGESSPPPGYSQQSATTTSSTAPWGPQQPYFLEQFDAANQLYNTYTPHYYPGQTVAGFTPAQQAALDATKAQAHAGEPITSAAMGFGTNLVGGGYLNANPGAALQMPFAAGQMADPGKNPYFQSSLNATLANVLPGITSQFVGGGNLNNPAMAFAAGQGAMNAVAPQLFGAYQQGLQQQQQAAQNIGGYYQDTLGKMVQGAQLAPLLQNLPYNDLAKLFAAGATEQQQQQQAINADIARWNWGQQLPYQKLATFGSEIGGPVGSTTTATTPYFTNNVANATGAMNAGGGLGGILGGGIGDLFGDAAAGAGIGSTIGELAPLIAMF